MVEAQAKKKKEFAIIGKIIRECIAISIWLCLFVKFVLFDFDVYLFENKFPQLSWLVRYRFVITMGVLATLWLILGSKRLKSIILYVIAYPFIIVFWKLPKLIIKNWPVALVFSLAFGDIVKSFKLNCILTSFALVAGLITLISGNTYLLAISMIYLGIVLSLHLIHKTRKAYGASIFEGLAGHVRSFRNKIEAGEVIKLNLETDKPTNAEDIKIEQLNKQNLSSAYMFNQFFEYLATELRLLAKSRKVDLYLILSLVYTRLKIR